MAKLRREEEQFRQIIEAELGLSVRYHDDNSKPSMHDLDVLNEEDVVVGAVEVTSAPDGDSIALWKLVNGSDERYCIPTIAGGWMLSLFPTANAKRLLKALPSFLARLEAEGVTSIGRVTRHRSHFDAELRELGISTCFQSGTDFPGSVYFTVEQSLERTGGVRPTNSDAFLDWISAFASEPAQADNIEKLIASGAPRRHLAVNFPTFNAAPFVVVDVLMQNDPPLPTRDPILPDEITDFWAVSAWNTGCAMWWSRENGWKIVDKNLLVAE